MTKSLYAILRYTTVVAMVAIIFVLSGCDKDSEDKKFNGTMLEFIKQDSFKQATTGSADNAFDSIVMYIDKFPDLAAYLSGSTEYTFFAPSNKAFVSLTALPGLADPDQINQEIIKGVLTYHFVAGRVKQSDLAAGASVNTLFTDPAAPGAAQVIKVNTDGTLLTGSTTTNIQISAADQETNNGVVHTTATVLIPPSTGGKLASILGTLGATVLLGKDFTYMAYTIGFADAGVATADQFTTMVANKSASLTLLAIPNAVYVGTYNAANGKAPTNVPTESEVKTFINSFTAAGARTILRTHTLEGKFTVAGSANTTKFANGVLTSKSGKALTVVTGLTPTQCSCSTGVLISAAKTGGTSNAPIVKADISTQVGIANGILQVVGGIFLP